MAKKKEQTEAQKQQINELENKPFETKFNLKQKNKEGNLVEYTLHYSYPELDVDRVGAAMTSYFAYEDVLAKPPSKVTDLDHINQQQFLKRFYASVLFERDEEGTPKPFNPYITENKAFELIGTITGAENHQILDQIKIDFFLNRGEIPTGLQSKVKSTTQLMLEDVQIRNQLVESLATQIVPNGKSKLTKQELDSLRKNLALFLEKK